MGRAATLATVALLATTTLAFFLRFMPHNLVLCSQELNVDGTGTPWNRISGHLTSITANALVAPDGTPTAELLTEDNSANDRHHVYQKVSSTTSGRIYTASVHATAGTRNFFHIKFGTDDHWISAVFDLSNGTVGQTATGAISGTITGTSISDLGNGWYRCAVSGWVSGDHTFITFGGAGAATGNTFKTNGDVLYNGESKTWSLWGAQIERDVQVSAYIPTATTRKSSIPNIIRATLGITPAWQARCETR